MKALRQKLLDGAAAAELASHLDALSHEDRLAEVRTLQGSALGKLYERVEGQHTDLAFFVPAGVADGQPVIHHGVNSLPWPVGGSFRKPMVRVSEGLINGYNDNDGVVSALPWFTGPGYFVMRDFGSDSPDGRTEHGGQMFVNYYERPDDKPVASWPDPNPTMQWSANLVFGEMCDYMWRVSEHVSVGAAYKRGKAVGAWFALVRED